MLYCPGSGCPLRQDCYRWTQPTPSRSQFGSPPFDPVSGSCAHFVSNQPTEEQIRTTAYFIWLHSGRPSDQAEIHWALAAAQWARNMGRSVDESRAGENVINDS